ncbi:MAG: ABC transporter permease [Candidatus Helarchaeota archaeon]
MFILLFYLVNKFILQSFKYELGPLLIGTSVGWSLISGGIGMLNLLGFEFAGLFNYALKSLIYRKQRTYAAIIGITVAVGLIVTPIPIISGYYAQLTNLANQQQYAEYIILLEQDQTNYYNSRIDEDVLKVLTDSNLQIVSPETYINPVISINQCHYQINMRGIDYSVFQNFRDSFSFQNLPTFSFSNQHLIIGANLATLLNISYSTLPINFSISQNTNSVNATIIGILSSNLHYDSELFAPINLTRQLNSNLIGKFSLIEIKLKDATQIDTTLQNLENNVQGVDAERENQMTDFVAGIIARTIQSMWYLSFVVYIVMIFGMFHVMNTIVNESKREITIFKAIGASQFQLIRIFLYQTALLCLIGTILGVVGGMFLSYSASYLVSSITNITVQPEFTLPTILFAVTLGFTAGIVGGLYPAYHGSKLKVGGREY